MASGNFFGAKRSNGNSNNSKKRNSSNLSSEVPKFQNNNSASTKINLNDYEEVEDEYGFRYMRKKQKLLAAAAAASLNHRQEEDEDDCVTSTPVPKAASAAAAKLVISAATSNTAKTIPSRTNEAFSPSTPTPSKQILENARKKRRSSFAAAVAGSQHHQSNSTARNSFGVSLLQGTLPPNNVKTVEYHRHLQPDLPGPVKMRQLLIWACQKAAERQGGDTASMMKTRLVDGLLNNEISTSWYQRPSSSVCASNNQDSSIYSLPNPQNQELSECIDLYKNYHMKLEKECEIWKSLQQQQGGKSSSNSILNIKTILNNEASKSLTIDSSLNQLFAEEFGQLNKWIHSLPMSVDRLDWNTKLALSFQDHAKQFCEGVFHQIFAKFFSSDLIRSSKSRVASSGVAAAASSTTSSSNSNNKIEPMMILRALSTNQQQIQ